MDMNWLVIGGITVLSMLGAMLWFGTLFGNLWIKIHGWESMSKAELKAQEQGMGKLLVLETINTVFMISILAFLLANIDGYSPLLIAFLLWLGFLYPSCVSCVIWGADKKEWQSTKIMILAGFNLIVVLISAYLLTLFS